MVSTEVNIGERNKEFKTPLIASLIGIAIFVFIPFFYWEERIIYSYDYSFYPFGLMGRSFHFLESPGEILPIMYFLLGVLIFLIITAVYSYVIYSSRDSIKEEYIKLLHIGSLIATIGIIVCTIITALVIIDHINKGQTPWNGSSYCCTTFFLPVNGVFIWIIPYFNARFFSRFLS